MLHWCRFCYDYYFSSGIYSLLKTEVLIRSAINFAQPPQPRGAFRLLIYYSHHAVTI